MRPRRAEFAGLSGVGFDWPRLKLPGWCLAAALVIGPRHAPAAPDPTARASTETPSLLDRVGALHLERSLRSRDARLRERAIERLGALGTARSLELLVRALDANGSAESPRERLLAVRALADHVSEPSVRECLVRVMTGVSANAERADPVQALLRDTAALALSASGQTRAVEALVKALRQPGRVAQAAARALVAHPPARLNWAQEKRFLPSLELIAALEDLGDPRALDLLRDAVRRGTPELRARASVALSRLSPAEARGLIDRFAAPSSPAVLRLAAAEILLTHGDSAASSPLLAPLLSNLLEYEETRTRALELSARGVSGLVPALSRELSRATLQELPWLITALVRTGDAQAFPLLGGLLDRAVTADTTAYALALSAAPEALLLLEQASQGREGRLAARALVLRETLTGERSSQLHAQLNRWLSGSNASERSVASFGLGLLEPERLSELLSSSHPEVVQAAARAGPFVGRAELLVEHLEKAVGQNRTQLALALVDTRARQRVPSAILEVLATEGGVAAPLAIFALAERDSETSRERIRGLLSAPDPVLRAHAAQGLGLSREPSALGVLVDSYTFETDARVRRALIRSIGMRKERVRERWLRRARALDPDARVRELAALALVGVRAGNFEPGRGTLWLRLDTQTQGSGVTATPPADAPAAAPLGAVSVLTPGGLALPVLADPDGFAVLARLPEGPVSLTLALEPHARKPAEEKR